MKNKDQHQPMNIYKTLQFCIVFPFISTVFLWPPPPARTSADNCPTGMSCGSYTISGLGARKQQILKSGANTLDLAIAMLETDTMQPRFYPYGDGKTGDASNFGIFKQNWYMLRSTCTGFKNLQPSDYNTGAILNNSLTIDINCLIQSQRFYGLDIWFAGERNGQTGINNPNTSDIARYKTAVSWIQSQLMANAANLSNNTRFWVAVPSI